MNKCGCIDGIINYYMNKNVICDKKKEKKWYFKNGTVVSAENITSAELKIINTCLNTSRIFYSSEIDDELWEVQFCNNIFPDVFVTVKAKNGKIAADYAICLLRQDRDNLELVDIY